MFRSKERIKIIIGILIVVSIFVFIAISTLVEKCNNTYSLLNYEDKISNNIPEECREEIVDVQAFGGYSIKVDKSKNIVGFLLSGDATKCFSDIKNQLLHNK